MSVSIGWKQWLQREENRPVLLREALGTKSQALQAKSYTKQTFGQYKKGLSPTLAQKHQNFNRGSRLPFKFPAKCVSIL